MREHHRTHTYDTHFLGVRDRICISRYPDSHLSRNNSSGWGGRLSLLSRNTEFCFDAAQLSFVLIPEVYPKTVVWNGNGNRRWWNILLIPRKKPKKRDVWKEKGKVLVLKYVGRTDGACLVALFGVQAGHLRTCLP